MRVALIGCGKQKAATTCAARAMYRSQLFQASLRWALMRCDRTLILSAKHGLLDLDTRVEPYDETLPRAKADREAWGTRVGAQIVAAVGEIDAQLVVLAGEKYADAISFDSPEWEYGWEEPLRGMEIGQRLAWLKAQPAFDLDGEGSGGELESLLLLESASPASARRVSALQTLAGAVRSVATTEAA